MALKQLPDIILRPKSLNLFDVYLRYVTSIANSSNSQPTVQDLTFVVLILLDGPLREPLPADPGFLVVFTALQLLF